MCKFYVPFYESYIQIRYFTKQIEKIRCIVMVLWAHAQLYLLNVFGFLQLFIIQQNENFHCLYITGPYKLISHLPFRN